MKKKKVKKMKTMKKKNEENKIITKNMKYVFIDSKIQGKEKNDNSININININNKSTIKIGSRISSAIFDWDDASLFPASFLTPGYLK